jgi:protein-arginine kinase activator protein McsA
MDESIIEEIKKIQDESLKKGFVDLIIKNEHTTLNVYIEKLSEFRQKLLKDQDYESASFINDLIKKTKENG